MIKNCFSKHPELKERVKALVDKGMSEHEAGVKVITDEHESLHKELNKLKKSIGKKQSPYSPIDKTPEVEKIKSEYQSKIDEQTTNKNAEPIPEDVTTTEKSDNKEPLQENINDGGQGNAEPPNAVSVGNEFKDMSGGTILSHKGLQEVADEFALADVTPRERISDAQEFADADKTITKWISEKTYSKNIDKLISDAESGEALNFQQRVILQQHLANERGRVAGIRNEKGVESPEYSKALDELNKLKLAGEKARSTAGAALRVGEIRSETKDTVEDWMTEKMESTGVDELTPEQKKDIQKRFEEYDARLKKEKELRDKSDEEISKLKAELELKTERQQRSTIRKKNNESLQKERTDIITSIKEKWKGAGKDKLSSDIPYRQQLAAIAPDVLRLARNLSDTGALKLEDIADNIYEDLKDIIQSKKDVTDIIAGKYNEKKQTRSELSVKWKDITDEAKLINELERLYAGEPKTPKQALERNQRIKDLRGKIKDFHQSEADQARQVKELEKEAERAKREAEKEEERFIREFEKEKESEAKRIAKAKLDEAKRISRELDKKTPEEKILQAIKTRNENQKKQIEKDIAEGNFETKRKLPFDENTALKKANPSLWRETMDAISERREAKHQWELSKIEDEMAKRGKVKKVADFASGIIHTSRAIVSGIDDSFVFVQAGIAMAANPRSGLKAFNQHWRDAISRNRFNRQLAALHSSPYWDTISKSGLDVLEPASLTAKKVEEAFDKNLLNKSFKLDGKEYNLWTHTGGIFERAFISMGNNLRVNLFLKKMESLYNQGKTYESHPQEYKDAARVVNEMTGRGKLNKYVEQASPYITPIIWSPKMIASSLNILGLSDLAALTGRKGYYASLTPEIRKYAITQTVKGIGVGIALMAAASYGGADVDYDPTSVTFGNVKFGSKSYNVFGRFSGYVKTILMTILGKREVPSAGEQNLSGKQTQGVVGKFFRGKMTPAAGYGFDLWKRENSFTREKMSPSQIPTQAPDQLLQPLSIRSMRQGLEQDGSLSLLTRFLPSFVGLQVSDDRDFPNSTKKERKQKIGERRERKD